MLTIGKEFVCSQKCANEHDTHTAAVYRVGDEVLEHLPREFSHVAFFLEHNGSITGRVTDRKLYCCDEIFEFLLVRLIISVMNITLNTRNSSAIRIHFDCSFLGVEF